MALISLRDVSVAFGGPPLLNGLNLQLEAGERLCLMGRNGTGKSTLLKLITGEINPDGGEIFRQQGLKVALVSQEIPQGLTGTVFDVVAGGTGEGDAHLDDADGWRHHQAVERVLSRLKLGAEASFETLSGGTKRRAMLARALASTPDILLLDEPTNHLDIESIEWLEGFLLKQVRTLLFVTHDRAFARRISNRVAELDRGNLYAFDCGYDAFVARREELLAAEVTRQALFDKKLAEEEVWVRQGIKARRTRNEGRVRALQALRGERGARRTRVGTARIQIQDAERSGKLVVEAQGATFGYGGRPVIGNLTTTIISGDKVGIIGPNGSGKTTLLRLLLGELPPQHGTVKLGSRLEVLYFDQLRDKLDLESGSGERRRGERHRHHQRPAPAHHRLSPGFPLHAGAGAQSGAHPLRRGAQPAAAGQAVHQALQRPRDGRADQRPGRRDARPARRAAAGVRRDTAAGEPRPGIPEQRGDQHAGARGDGEVQEFVGGYDDWLRQAAAVAEHAKMQAAARVAPQTKGAGASAAAAPQAGKTAKPKKLTFKEVRELEALPERISELEMEKETLHLTLADPNYYRSAKDAVAKLTARLAQLEVELAEAYRRWEELESVRG